MAELPPIAARSIDPSIDWSRDSRLVERTMLMWMLRCALVGLGVGLAACQTPPAGSDPATEYRGGRWFDGETFVAKTMWVAGETFVESRLARVGAVVDLNNGYVVPPYAEGHNHWLEPALVDAYVQTYLRATASSTSRTMGPPRCSTTRCAPCSAARRRSTTSGRIRASRAIRWRRRRNSQTETS